ncbi:MAG: AraC family transcriptional regulator [Phreatobacter sp.]|uniref:helix-turn-helix transcriptional regulator n=1 Tax=Phreatobacter sp. TaxID=1966341 RepID=UPI002733AA64|nr:AraC family transcriptional regulator [Phreatobacter sp.]MDP2800910.1 AraC family transcriptional regulator [Phreatobacter sp.]
MNEIPVVAYSARCDSADAVEHFFARQWGQVHRLTSQENLSVWHADFYHFAGLTLLSARSDGAYSFITEIPSQNVQIVVPRSDCHSVTRAGHDTHHSRLGFGTVIDMRQVTRGQVGSGWSGTQLSVPYPMIEQAVARNLGYLLKKRVVFEPTFSLSDPRQNFFASYLHSLHETATRSPEFGASPLAISSTVDAIMQYVVNFLHHSYSEHVHSAVGSVEASKLMRAIDFMAAHLHEPIVVEDVANAVGISVRSLQLAFRDKFDCTPMQHLRRLRLKQVHDEIAAIGPQANVKRIAMRWGFAHWRLFKTYYRNEFGRDP